MFPNEPSDTVTIKPHQLTQNIIHHSDNTDHGGWRALLENDTICPHFYFGNSIVTANVEILITSVVYTD